MKQSSVNSIPAPGATPTVGALLRGNALPRLECSLLLAHLLQTTRESVLAHPETLLSANGAEAFAELTGRRLRGEPIAYLVGMREFYGMRLRVTPEVLIPRPETELLVDAALRRLAESSTVRVLDLGTGSGAVAIAIAAQRPHARVEAIDVEPGAVALATANARLLAVANVQCHESNWYAGCREGHYEVIVSNPPYIAASDPHLTQGDLRFEPRIALTPGSDGLEAIREIVHGAAARLAPGGWLLFEHGYDQAERCRDLMDKAGFAEIATLRDLAGIGRVCEGRKPLVLAG
ncbi:MAG: peptide chain release factor N(5)-glutamine methyltransferase [Betaproteobacteria bacterium]|nr:peptide chain release factor N(5)-glutamine methyltransferase [Betaproteobacteria bacterium]